MNFIWVGASVLITHLILLLSLPRSRYSKVLYGSDKSGDAGAIFNVIAEDSIIISGSAPEMGVRPIWTLSQIKQGRDNIFLSLLHDRERQVLDGMATS